MSDILGTILPAVDNGSAFDELYREYLGDRTLFLNDEISEAVIEDYIMYILKWNKEDKGLPIECRKPIKLYISSPGGNVFDANVFMNVIEMSKTPVWGIGMDLVASAAFHIYIACHKRYSMKDTAFLIHDGEIAIENSRKKFRDTAEFFNQGDERLKNHILKNTSITEEFYKSIYSDEFWFYADRGKELGVVHKIIGEDASLDEIL